MNAYLKFMLSLSLLTACACNRGDGLARIAVHGSVTHEGQPLENGLITFRPVRGASGVSAGTDIQGGRYSIPVDRGPVAGSYEVEIKVIAVKSNPADAGKAKAARSGSLRMQSFSQPVEIRQDGGVLDFQLPFSAAAAE